MLENKFNADGFFCVHLTNGNEVFYSFFFYGNTDFQYFEWNWSNENASNNLSYEIPSENTDNELLFSSLIFLFYLVLSYSIFVIV